MPRRVLVERASRAIVILDPPEDYPLPEGVEIDVLDLEDAESTKLNQPGSYTVSGTGVVTVTAPGPETAATVEHDSALADLESQYAAAMIRLTQIVGATTPTNPQVVVAIQDLARYVKVLARLNHAEFVGDG